MSTYLNDARLPFTYTSPATIALNAIIFDWDTQEIESPALALSVSSVGVGGVFTVEFSSNEVNWQPGYIEVTASGAAAATFNATGLFSIPKLARFIRLRCSTAQTSGTTALSVTKQYHPLRAPFSGATTVTVAGTTAHDGAVTGNPIRVAGRALNGNYAAVASGDVADFVTTLVGAQIAKPYSIPEADWQYAAAAGGIINTTDVVARTAGAAGIRNYVTGLQVRNTNAVATEFVVKDGATVIWRTQLPAAMTGSMEVSFPSPLKSAAATAINLACITTGAAVFANLQGYQAP